MPYRPKGSRFWHYDFQIRGRRFHGSCGTEDYAAAKAVEASARVDAGKAPEVTGRFTLDQALGTYWLDVCQHQNSARVAKSQFAGILSIMDGKKPMDALTNADLMKFVARRRAEVSNATVNRQLQSLGRALRHMVKIHGAKMPEIDLLALQTPEPEERVRALSWDEQERLFQHLRPDLKPFVTFALMTGARLATICDLQWQDIRDDDGRMTFRVKGAKTMRFPLSRDIRALLSALPHSDLPEHRRYVFTYEVQNRKAKPRRRIIPDGGGLMEDWRKALEAAEVYNFRFHDLRHTFATRMLRATGNIKLVSRLLGHADVETTSRYAHVMDEDMEGAIMEHSMVRSPVSRRKSRSAS